MNWRQREGQVEVFFSKGSGATDTHVLTHQLLPEDGAFQQVIRLSLEDVDSIKAGKKAGFKFGIVGKMPWEFRSNLFLSKRL